MNQIVDTDEFRFVPPIPRAAQEKRSTTFRLTRSEFLTAAEAVIPSLHDHVTGVPWQYDGYRSTALYLTQPPNTDLGTPQYTVEFALHIEPQQVTISIQSSNQQILDLYHRFTRELAFQISKEVF